MNVIPFKVTLEALLSNGASYVGTSGGHMLVRETSGHLWQDNKAMVDRVIMVKVADDTLIETPYQPVRV